MTSKIVNGFNFKSGTPLKDIQKVRAQIRTYAIRNLQDPLQKIVDPFQTNIKIETRTKTVGDTFTATVRARDNIETTNRASGKPIASAKIFEFLNSGTKVSYVRMPQPYSHATSPNSLITQSAEYNRNGISFRKESIKGISARNWTTLLDKQRAPATKRLLDKIGDFIVSRTKQV